MKIFYPAQLISLHTNLIHIVKQISISILSKAQEWRSGHGSIAGHRVEGVRLPWGLSGSDRAIVEEKGRGAAWGESTCYSLSADMPIHTTSLDTPSGVC